VPYSFPSVSADPTDAEIEARLRAAPADAWRLFADAIDAVEAERVHATWTGMEQVDTVEVDGVTRPVFHMPYPTYSDAVRGLLSAIGAVGAAVPFDWMAWEGRARLTEPAAIDAAPVADAVRLVTSIVRGERFADGTIDAALDSGVLIAAVRRVQRWGEEQRPAGRRLRRWPPNPLSWVQRRA
jgi:hypothetical protein